MTLELVYFIPFYWSDQININLWEGHFAESESASRRLYRSYSQRFHLVTVTRICCVISSAYIRMGALNLAS